MRTIGTVRRNSHFVARKVLRLLRNIAERAFLDAVRDMRLRKVVRRIFVYAGFL